MIFVFLKGKVELLTNTTVRRRMIEHERGKNEEWKRLCEQAAVEQDPERLLALTREINRLLKEREDALKDPVPRL